MTTRPHLYGRLVLSLFHLGGTAASFLLDWRSNHLLNPEWPPHARFHGGLYLFAMAGCALTSLWLLWRPSREPAVAIVTATLLLLAFWTPLFYVNSIVPASSLWAGPVAQEPRWGGRIVYPNLVFAGGVVALSLLAAALSLARRAAPKPAS